MYIPTFLVSDGWCNTQRIEDGRHKLTSSCYLTCNCSHTEVGIT